MRISQLLGVKQSTLLVFLIGAFLLFFILRELFTWYWKINEVVALLEKIEQNTRPKNTDKIPEKVVVKSQPEQDSRTALDKWWNGPDKENN